jgi:hypothetical protein
MSDLVDGIMNVIFHEDDPIFWQSYESYHGKNFVDIFLFCTKIRIYILVGKNK